MTDTSPENPPPPPAVTVQLQQPPLRSALWRAAFVGLVLASFTLNLLLCGLVGLFSSSEPDEEAYPEKVLYGPKKAGDKVAIVRIEGVLFEGMTAFPLKQIEKAMKDDKVKAVVVRIDSPGGTISASEELHKHLLRLRDGKSVRVPDARPKPLVASMGSLAASGGYYVAMPAGKVFAERTTLTGSIGVFASLPNVSELAERVGFRMELIKAGAIKASGSPFHELTPQERQPWQDMVDHAYDRFLEVVAEGRPGLTKEKLRGEILFEKPFPLRDGKGNVVRNWWGMPQTASYSRYRADGGTFTADEAKRYGLIDDIGDLEDAVATAASAAGLGEYKVVIYQRPPSLLSGLLGLNAQRLASGFTPRLWYLAPASELAGMISTVGSD